jgi:hypothetical protein
MSDDHNVPMSEADGPGTVTICKGQGLFLRADDAGVLIRNFHFGHARRIAWTEISHFADGRYTKEGVTSWCLVIILRTGKQVPVLCPVLEPADKPMAGSWPWRQDIPDVRIASRLS